jgi:predicted GIY-YIG superfamily endonuclease
MNRRMYYVYMLASRRYGTLYIGVTNDPQSTGATSAWSGVKVR